MKRKIFKSNIKLVIFYKIFIINIKNKFILKRFSFELFYKNICLYLKDLKMF